VTAPANGAAGNAPTVVVVDDDALSRVMVSDLLVSLGCRAVHCASAADALATITGAVPAACLVDQVMPRVTGAQLIRVLRTSGNASVKAMPLVGMTASGPGEMIAAGATLCLEKPITRAKLARALEEVGVIVRRPGSRT
jgi:CheY-like chemotaxis protein